MKKCWIIVLALMLLTGCTGPALETLGSIPQRPSTEDAQAQVLLELPQTAVADVFGSEEDILYTCDGYTISMKTLPAGDLKATVQTLSGYDPQQLSIVESSSGAAERYDFVWTAAAEQGELVGRAAVIDDGAFHYCLCVYAQAADAGSLGEEWNRLFSSFYLETA